MQILFFKIPTVNLFKSSFFILHAGIKDLGVIADCHGLIYLDLSQNNITDVNGLGIKTYFK